MIRALLFDPAYQRHERGEIAWDEYVEHLRTTLKLGATVRSPADVRSALAGLAAWHQD